MSFADRVYAVTKKIPKGKVATYKSVGAALNTKAYRAIGVALSKNPYAPLVPCHRVVRSDGSIGGFMGKTSGTAIDKKILLLQDEGVMVKNNKIEDFKEKNFIL